MNRTTNYNLKKPELEDSALITDLCDDMDIIDAQLKLANDAASGVAEDLAAGLATKQDKITGAASVIASQNLDPDKVLVSSPTTGKVIVSSTTAAELGRLSGVSSPIQAQLNGKQDTISGAASTITGTNLTANRVLVSNASGKVAASGVLPSELARLSGVTGDIQTQLNSKQDAITGAASVITSQNLDPGYALVSSPTAGKVIVSNVSAEELSRLSGVTSGVQSQLNGKAPTSHASTGTGYGVGTAAAYGHVKVRDSFEVSSFDSAAPEVLSAYRGYLLNNAIDAKSAYIIGANNTVNASIASGNTQNLLPSSASDNTYFSVTTGGVFTFKKAGTYLMLTRFQTGSPTSGTSVARLDLEARYREAGATAWGSKNNIGSNWVTGSFGTVMGMNIVSAPSDGYQMFLDVLAVDGAAKLNAFAVLLMKLS